MFPSQTFLEKHRNPCFWGGVSTFTLLCSEEHGSLKSKIKHSRWGECRWDLWCVQREEEKAWLQMIKLHTDQVWPYVCVCDLKQQERERTISRMVCVSEMPDALCRMTSSSLSGSDKQFTLRSVIVRTPSVHLEQWKVSENTKQQTEPLQGKKQTAKYYDD